MKRFANFAMVAAFGVCLAAVGCAAGTPEGSSTEQAQQAGSGDSCSNNSFSGRAEALKVRGLITADIADTGDMPATGGEFVKNVATADLPGLLHLDALHAEYKAGDSSSYAEAATAKLVLGAGAIKADLLKATATAECQDGKPSVSGTSSVLDLRINGEPVVVGDKANQLVDVPGLARIVINEQIPSEDGSSITVNALHVTLLDSQEVWVSTATAGIQCGCGE